MGFVRAPSEMLNTESITGALDLMRIVIVYICVSHGPHSQDLASRFIGSYLTCSPGFEHDVTIVFNGLNPPPTLEIMFDCLPGIRYPRPNDPSWDIGAYQEIAINTDADMLVCLGESVYFHREGWLKKIVEAW